jgi:hypothetical protein
MNVYKSDDTLFIEEFDEILNNVEMNTSFLSHLKSYFLNIFSCPSKKY